MTETLSTTRWERTTSTLSPKSGWLDPPPKSPSLADWMVREETDKANITEGTWWEGSERP